MMQWETKKLGDVADFYLGKMLDKKKNKGELLPYLANVNVRWGEFELGDLREMRFENREKERYGLEHGDIVMCEGGEPGRCAIWKNQIPGMMFQKALHRIRPNDCLDNRFLYYCFLNRGQEGGFDQYCTGSTIKHLPRQNLAMVEVSVPPLATQQSIACILSAYDELIENNTRRIEILEEMARLLYEEWFVHFRFPGYEKVSFKESELGKIPMEWEISELDHLMSFQGGSQPPKCEWVEKQSDGYVRMVQIRDYASDSYVAYVRDTKKLRKCGPLDIMIARYGASVGRICWGLSGAYNVALVKVQPKGPHFREFLRSTLSGKTTQELLIGMSGRTAQAGFNKSILKSISVAVPSDPRILYDFESFALPIRKEILVLRAKNANLRAQRDALLPKLVTGEIDVSTLLMPNDEEVDAA